MRGGEGGELWLDNDDLWTGWGITERLKFSNEMVRWAQKTL